MTSGGSALDDARRALYAGSRTTFVERRKELADASRGRGGRDEARLIGQMRKPSAAAHLVNQLAQADDITLRQLIELGASIRSAMATGSDGEIRSLLQGRAAALAKTVAHVKEIARASGESVSGPVNEQIVQTLRAAMASDEAAEAVRRGTLTDALDEPGFDGFNIESAARPPLPKVSGRKKTRRNADVDRAVEDAREAAQAQIASASADVKRAEMALTATIERREGLERDRDRLAAQLAQVEDDLIAERAELDAERAELDAAEARLSAAVDREPQALR